MQMALNSRNCSACGARCSSPFAVRCRRCVATPEERSALAERPAVLAWTEIPRTALVTPLSVSGPYVISHRAEEFTLSHRPPGVHKHVGTGETLDEAKALAEDHHALNLAGLDGNGYAERYLGFSAQHLDQVPSDSARGSGY